MRSTVSIDWLISLDETDAFRMEGRRYDGAPERVVVVDKVKPSYFGDLELSGRVVRKNGSAGEARYTIRVPRDHESIPKAIRDEIARVEAHRDRFISKVQS